MYAIQELLDPSPPALRAALPRLRGRQRNTHPALLLRRCHRHRQGQSHLRQVPAQRVLPAWCPGAGRAVGSLGRRAPAQRAHREEQASVRPSAEASTPRAGRRRARRGRFGRPDEFPTRRASSSGLARRQAARLTSELAAAVSQRRSPDPARPAGPTPSSGGSVGWPVASACERRAVVPAGGDRRRQPVRLRAATDVPRLLPRPRSRSPRQPAGVGPPGPARLRFADRRLRDVVRRGRRDQHVVHVVDRRARQVLHRCGRCRPHRARHRHVVRLRAALRHLADGASPTTRDHDRAGDVRLRQRLRDRGIDRAARSRLFIPTDVRRREPTHRRRHRPRRSPTAPAWACWSPH